MRDGSVSYRPDIDGWRAVAVIAVVAHHFDKTWLPGGYLGVDVFFVISGFVITLSLLGRKADGFLPFLADFYARRMRRLMPALVACVLVTSFAIWLVDPASRQSLSTGIAALFGVANITLARQDVDYFSPSTELNAFTHTWSLGVEEQFYLVYPLMLWFLFKVGRTPDPRGARRFIIALAAMMAASYVVFVATAHTFPVFNYYQLPARFWELAAGALTCLFVRDRDIAGWKFAAPIAAAALAISLTLPIEQRVMGTTLAVLATVTLLATTPSNVVLSSILTQPGMRFLGRISYPLYLWHWSVLAVSRFTIGVSIATAPVQIILMLALSWVTYRYIESPVRHGFRFATNRRVLLTGLGVALVCAAAPIALRLKQQIGPIKSASFNVVPAAHLPLIGSGEEFDAVCVVDGGKWRRKPDMIDKCTAPPVSPETNTIWAFGDSHAGQLEPLLYGVRDRTGMGAHITTVPDTPFPSVVDNVAAREGRITFDTVSPRFKPGDIVVLGRLYLEKEGPQRAQSDVDAWIRKAAAFAGEMEPRGIRVVVVGPLPMFRFASVLSCVRSLFPSECAVSRRSLSVVVDGITRQIEAALLGHPNMSLFRPFDIVCPPTVESCTPFLGDQLVFRDHHHLNVAGSGALVGPFMVGLGLVSRDANRPP